MEANKTNWFSFLRSLEDVTRNGKSQFTGAEAFNEFINLLFLKFKENDIKKMLEKQEDNVEDDEEEHDRFLIMGSVDEDFLISTLYDKYCKLYDDNQNKQTDANTDKMIKKQTDELYSILYDFSRQYDEKNQYDESGEPTGTIIKSLNGKKKCVMGRFMHNDDFYNVISGESKPDNITQFTKNHAIDIVNLIIKIHKNFENKVLTEFDYDAFGEGYEKYTADEVMSAKSWGQYFTRRDVIEMIVNEIKPHYSEKGSDEACGTGGFILNYVKYVRESLKKDLSENKITKKQYRLRYNEFKNNIHGYELKWSVYKPLMLNLMCRKINLDNIILGSCLSEENFEKGEMYDFMAGNPPFGGSLPWELWMDDKINIKVKNSVALILQLYLYKLKPGGRCGLVVDRGVLNNGTDKKNAWEKSLRKKMLVENNLYKVILLPTGIFAHTNFATAIIFFVKGGKSKQVEFVEGYFKDEDKGTGNKPMYFKDSIVVDAKKLKEKKYSLKLDDYIDKPKEDVVDMVKIEKVIGKKLLKKEQKYKKDDFSDDNINEIMEKSVKRKY
jgi:type I restriction-modification system DNA methylase subunit